MENGRHTPERCIRGPLSILSHFRDRVREKLSQSLKILAHETSSISQGYSKHEGKIALGLFGLSVAQFAAFILTGNPTLYIAASDTAAVGMIPAFHRAQRHRRHRTIN